MNGVHLYLMTSGMFEHLKSDPSIVEFPGAKFLFFGKPIEHYETWREVCNRQNEYLAAGILAERVPDRNI